MTSVFSRIVIVTCTIIYVLLVTLMAWTTFEAVRYSIGFTDYPQPYRATVVGFDAQRGVKNNSYAPIVRVVPLQLPEFTFTSRKHGNFNWVSVGDSVQIVHKPVSIFGLQTEALEMKGAYHLWIRDVALFFILLVPALCIFWPFLRDRLERQRRDKDMFENSSDLFRR